MEDQSKVDVRFSIQPRSSSLLSGHVSVGTTCCSCCCCCTSVVLGFSSANNVVVVVVGVEGETVVSGVGAIEEGESEYDDIFFIFLFLMYSIYINSTESESESPQIYFILFYVNPNFHL